MRFAFVTTNLAGGGAERGIANLARLLAGRGHHSELILLEHHFEHAPPEGLPITTVTPPGRRLRKGWLGRRALARRLAATVRERGGPAGFDVIVSTLPFADRIVAQAGLERVWFRIANTLSEELRVLAGRSPRKAARRLARYRELYGEARLIAVSAGVADDLRRELGLERATIRRIYNPIDFERIRRLAAERPPGLPEVPFLIHAGRFARQKRHDVLLDAWALLRDRRDRLAEPPAQLLLLTEEHPELRAMIAVRGLEGSVRIAGFQTNPYPWIAAAELLVLSSEREGMPNVLAEALACGTRVASSDCRSGPREILGRHYPEALAPVGDPAALAEAIARQLTQPFVPHPEALAEFDLERVLARYEGLARQDDIQDDIGEGGG